MDLVISNADSRPIYAQIADQVKSAVIAGRLAAGEALPSMRLLARQLHISVITTKRAYEELERDGFLENVAGKGCFVAQKNTEFLREEQLRKTEEALRGAVAAARGAGISLDEMNEMLALLYDEHGQGGI